MADDLDRDAIYSDFMDAVNMAPSELEEWLDTDESKSVGNSDSGESTGHKSGRRIVEIKNTKKADLTGDQLHHMKKVVGYINRHCAQVPDEPDGSDWAHSLKNWGHDPIKDDGCA
ncbi:MAG: DUF3140 domain-containing protein [Pacificimonas sp.]